MKKAALLLCFMLAQVLSAQNQYVQRSLLWLNPQTIIPLSQNQQLTVGVQWRSYMFPQRIHQLLIPTIYYSNKVNPQWTWAAGALYFRSYSPADPFKEVIANGNEYRTYQDLFFNQELAKGQIRHRGRIEQRFFELFGDTRFVFRTRYRIEYRYPLKFKGIQSTLKTSLETHWQFGQDLRPGEFDQARFRASWQIPFKPIGIEPGYIFWFQQTAIPNRYYSHHIIQLIFTYRIPKKKQP